MFGWEYPPLHAGGLGVACQGLVRGLSKTGVKVTLVLPMDLRNHPEAAMLRGPADAEGIEIDGEGSIRFVQSALQPYENQQEYAERMQSLSAHGVAPGGSIADLYGPDLGEAVWRYAEQSVAITKDLHPDVVHCHDWMTYEAGIRASRYHRVPLITHIHATEFDRTHFQPNGWIADQERRGFEAADQIIAVSNYTKNLLVEHYGINPRKITVVYNGHDAPRSNLHLEHKNVVRDARSMAHPPLVLFLGRLTTQKNPGQFLDVAKLVHDELPAVQFVMAGEGGMLPELLDRTCRMGLSENMIFTGKVGKREAERLYRQADCFVMPSVSEPFGLVALEAIAHGTPVILSKQSGAAEVIDHAFKVDFWDTAKMADCIVTVLREEPLAMQLRSEAPSILKRLSWKNQAGEVTTLYKNILSSR